MLFWDQWTSTRTFGLSRAQHYSYRNSRTRSCIGFARLTNLDPGTCTPIRTTSGLAIAQYGRRLYASNVLLNCTESL